LSAKSQELDHSPIGQDTVARVYVPWKIQKRVVLELLTGSGSGWWGIGDGAVILALHNDLFELDCSNDQLNLFIKRASLKSCALIDCPFCV
jgi:hypothetical protein